MDVLHRTKPTWFLAMRAESDLQRQKQNHGRDVVISGIRTGFSVSLDDQILAHIRAAKVWDKGSKPEDYQIRAHPNGVVLVNLKTGRAHLLYDEDSELQDWKELFPNVIPLPERRSRF